MEANMYDNEKLYRPMDDESVAIVGQLLNDIEFSCYGHPHGEKTSRYIYDPTIHGYRLKDKVYGIDLIIRPYYWGDSDTSEGKYISNLPNLEHTPSGYKCSWYKYYGRGMYDNGVKLPFKVNITERINYGM